MGGPALIDGELVDEVDNFLYCKFVVDGVEYYSTENYFQCAKCTDMEERDWVRNSGPGFDVWSVGNKVQLRPDWEIVKVRQMYIGNKAKFEQNEAMRNKLLSTKGTITFEGYSFWYTWNARILELVREELRGDQGDKDKIKELWALIDEYEIEQGRQ